MAVLAYLNGKDFRIHRPWNGAQARRKSGKVDDDAGNHQGQKSAWASGLKPLLLLLQWAALRSQNADASGLRAVSLAAVGAALHSRPPGSYDVSFRIWVRQGLGCLSFAFLCYLVSLLPACRHLC